MVPDAKVVLYENQLNVQYVKTNGGIAGYRYPKVITISSLEELYDYYQSNKRNYDFMSLRWDERRGKKKGFSDVIEAYNKEYFEDNVVVIVILQEASGSFYHVVNNIEKQNNDLKVSMHTYHPEMCTSDMAQWHLVMEVPKEIAQGSNIAIDNEYRVMHRSNVVADNSLSVISGEDSIEPYNNISRSKVYDKNIGKRVTVTNQRLRVKDIAVILPEIELKDELVLYKVKSSIEKITIYNERFEVCCESDCLHAGVFQGLAPSVYYVEMEYERQGEYVDAARMNNYHEGSYYFKIRITDKAYGLQKHLKQLCGVDVWNVDKAEFRALSNSDNGGLEHVRIDAGTDRLREFINILRASKLTMVSCDNAKRDSSRGILLYQKGKKVATIEPTTNGIYIDTGNGECYMELAPWGYEQMVMNLTGTVILPRDRAIDIAYSHLVLRGHIEAKEYEHIAQLIGAEYGAEWLVSYFVSRDIGNEKAIYTTVRGNSVTEIRTNIVERLELY